MSVVKETMEWLDPSKQAFPARLARIMKEVDKEHLVRKNLVNPLLAVMGRNCSIGFFAHGLQREANICASGLQPPYWKDPRSHKFDVEKWYIAGKEHKKDVHQLVVDQGACLTRHVNVAMGQVLHECTADLISVMVHGNPGKYTKSFAEY